MAETGTPVAGAGASAPEPSSGPRSKDEVALELMKFIAVTTGYGRSAGSGAGFSGKAPGKSAEEHADALFELYERCRKVVNQQ